MTNHTPAPWLIDEDGDVVGGKECNSCVAAGDVAGIGIDNPADRNLILAAPNMYEALCSVKLHMYIYGLGGTGIYSEVCRVLAKARGEV